MNVYFETCNVSFDLKEKRKNTFLWYYFYTVHFSPFIKANNVELLFTLFIM